MSHDSYLSGYIVVNDSIENIEAAIAQLSCSSIEDSWPFLTKGMFSITKDPRYRDDLVHFAASYKDILGSWNIWEKEFENLLLSKIAWDHVRIIINDCYRSDCLAVWDHEYKSEQRIPYKLTRYLNYKDDPEANFD